MRNGKLLGLYIEICSACNQNCCYCYNEKVIKQNINLSCEEIFRIIEEAKEMGVNIITLSGGEPLCHPHIREIVEFIYRQGCKTVIITNATLINNEMAIFLGRFKPELQLTLDGGIEDVHDMSRGKGTFKKQEKAIKLLKAQGYNDNIDIRTNLWKNNCTLENINSILLYCQKYGIKQLNVALAHETDRFSQIVDDYENCTNISKWIKKLEGDYKDIKIEFKEGKIDLGCPFVSEDATISCGIRVTSSGDVYPCQLFDDPLFKIGNIKSQSIESILNGKLLSNFLDMMKLRTNFIRECIECAFQGACSGGCPAKIFLQNGNILSVDQKCIDRKKVLQSGLIEIAKKKT